VIPPEQNDPPMVDPIFGVSRAEPAQQPPPLPPIPQKRSTTSKLLGLLVVVVCFEVGVFLVVFPWMDAWGRNAIPSLNPDLIELWESNYFRGALSGLGLVNIWISFHEMLRLLRG
jgi:hypothetical protein